MSGDEELAAFLWGVGIGVGCVLGYQHYFPSKPPVPVVASAPAKPVHPMGILQIATDKQSGDWTLDGSTVRGPRTARIGWVTITTPKPVDGISKVLNLYKVNCETTAAQVLSKKFYGPSGDPIMYPDSPDPVQYFAPASIGQSILDNICLAGFDEPIPTSVSQIETLPGPSPTEN